MKSFSRKNSRVLLQSTKTPFFSWQEIIQNLYNVAEKYSHIQLLKNHNILFLWLDDLENHRKNAFVGVPYVGYFLEDFQGDIKTIDFPNLNGFEKIFKLYEHISEIDLLQMIEHAVSEVKSFGAISKLVQINMITDQGIEGNLLKIELFDADLEVFELASIA